MQPTHDAPNHSKKAQKNPVVFWLENQIAFTFLPNPDPNLLNPNKQQIIDNLPLHELDQFLRERAQVKLRPFSAKDVPRRKGNPEGPDDPDQADRDVSQQGGHPKDPLKDPRAKYLFSTSGGKDNVLIAFFHLEPVEPGDAEVDRQKDHTSSIVRLINKGGFKDKRLKKLSAHPNWVGGGTGDVSHGCPVTPPYEVVDPDDVCAAKPGYHPITFTRLPLEVTAHREANGAGVTVLVLDTVPDRTVITAASDAVPKDANGVPTNGLLKEMADGLVVMNSLDIPLPAAGSAVPPAINIFYQALPGILDEQNNPHQPRTGKDIDGETVGFPMEDHGLSVSGIIRTIAPAANIVCARVLNDYGAGDVLTLIALLERIKDQLLLQRGDQNPHAFNPCLIVHMSLVVSPYNSQLNCLELGPISPKVRAALQSALEALADLNVIVVAAAGNDTDSRRMLKDTVTDMRCMPDPLKRGKHFGPRHPAAFASTIPQIIAVGAVDKTGRAARYSNYPGANGVATYGGGLLKRDKKKSRDGHTRPKSPIDALHVVHSASRYPALSRKDERLPGQPPGDYPETNKCDDRAWAYWSGTSFAAPIITGLVAGMLPAIPPAEARQRVIDLAGGNTVPWILHDLVTGKDIGVTSPVISAKQC